MSLAAILWAMKAAPCADTTEKTILISMAERADEDGCASFPSMRSLAEDALCDEKTAERKVKNLVARGLLALGDQRAAQYIDKRYRPKVYDLLIPFNWFSDIKDVNERRARVGRAPVTPRSRPDIAPAPPRRVRSDKGTPRRKKTSSALPQDSKPPREEEFRGDTQSPLLDDVQGGLSVPFRGDSQSRSGGTERPPNLSYEPALEPEEMAPQAARDAPTVAERPAVGSRDAGARERAGGGSAASVGSSMVPGPRVDMRPVREAVAPDLAALLPQPWPAVVAADVAAALRGGPTVGHERTIEQVAARVADRWYTHGYAQALIEGRPIRRPVGVLRALIAPPTCTAPRCEDGEDIDTHAVCRLCVERDADHAAERKPLRAV
jgi:hypothetical protein